MAYSAITNAEIDQDSPITQTLMTKYRDNVIFNAEGIWHPYNRTEPDGSEDGVFYDFATDGAVASVETPSFAADYDYLIILDGVSHSNGALGASIQIELYKDTDAAYGAVVSISESELGSANFYIEAFLRNPKGWTRQNALVTAASSDTTGNAGTYAGSHGDTTLQTCGKARLQPSGSNNFDAGEIALLRRKIILGL